MKVFFVFLRGQIGHIGHLSLFLKAKQEMQKASKALLIVAITLHVGARDEKDSFYCDEREGVYRHILTGLGIPFVIVFVRDFQSNMQWMTQPGRILKDLRVDPSTSEITVIDAGKNGPQFDYSTWFNWQQIGVPILPGVHATNLRREYFTTGTVKASAQQVLPEWRNLLPIWKQQHPDEFTRLALEWKNTCSIEEPAKAVVMWNDYILLARRRGYPGYNLYGLPAISTLTTPVTLKPVALGNLLDYSVPSGEVVPELSELIDSSHEATTYRYSDRVTLIDLSQKKPLFLAEGGWSRLPAESFEDRTFLLQQLSFGSTLPLSASLFSETACWVRVEDLPTMFRNLHRGEVFLIEDVLGRIPLEVCGVRY